jgi:hypothetical protein
MTAPTATRLLFWTWLPTAFGSSMLVAEIPVVYAAVARSADGAQALAALGIGVSILVIVNTPALAMAPLVVTAHDAAAAQLRRYALLVGFLGAGLLFALGAIPPFDALPRAALGLDEGLAGAVGGALVGLAPNSVAVALRRQLHGRLIRAGRTRSITVATVIRIAGTALAVWSGVTVFPSRGALIGGLALSVGAFIEATILTVAASRLPAEGAGAADWTFGRLAGQHAALSAARLLNMAPPAVTTIGIAHSTQSTASLVVWPALYELSALFASPTSDWDSVVATALRRSGDGRLVRRLTAALSAGFVGLFAAVLLTGAGSWYLRDLIAVPPDAAALGLHWAPLLLPVPAAWLLRGHFRGSIMAAGQTRWLIWASAVHLAALAALVALFSTTALPGVAAAGLAILGGLGADIAISRIGARTAANPGDPACSATGTAST